MIDFLQWLRTDQFIRNFLLVVGRVLTFLFRALTDDLYQLLRKLVSFRRLVQNLFVHENSVLTHHDLFLATLGSLFGWEHCRSKFQFAVRGRERSLHKL